MSANTLASQLRGIFGRRIQQPAAVQPVCPWFGAVDAKRFAAECTPGDRFVIRDPRGIAKGLGRRPETYGRGSLSRHLRALAR